MNYPQVLITLGIVIFMIGLIMVVRNVRTKQKNNTTEAIHMHSDPNEPLGNYIKAELTNSKDIIHHTKGEYTFYIDVRGYNYMYFTCITKNVIVGVDTSNDSVGIKSVHDLGYTPSFSISRLVDEKTISGEMKFRRLDRYVRVVVLSEGRRAGSSWNISYTLTENSTVDKRDLL